MTGSSTQTLFAFGLGAALLVLSAGSSSLRSEPACTGEAQTDRLQALTSHGDLVLASGQRAKLADIRLPDLPPYRDLALVWLGEKVNQPVLVQGSGNRDRWDRITVRIGLMDRSPPFDLGRGLVEAGLALVNPGPSEGLCQPELMNFEDNARKHSLGLWADDRYNPVQVEQMDRLRERVGRFVLVEGRIRSIGERKQRTYLNFGGHWAEDFTIIIPQKTWKQMADRGLGAEALKGQRIRARGILQSWQGLALTVVMPEMIERLEGKRLAR